MNETAWTVFGAMLILALLGLFNALVEALK